MENADYNQTFKLTPLFPKKKKVPKSEKTDKKADSGKLWWIAAIAVIAAIIGYIAWSQYASEKNAMERQIVANAVKNRELTEAFSYPTCAGEPDLTTLNRDRPEIRVRVLHNCWSGWIRVRGYCYLNYNTDSNVYVWFKEDYDNDLPPMMQVDGTHTHNNKSCYFRFRAEREPVEMTVEVR